ncbi:unnamed protein product [Rhizophagus irregularis]|nr:unnamed protein product [Rhizophagus irregularis]CAB5376342.1 unnamed protein product [Rhizophagus irregularis]
MEEESSEDTQTSEFTHDDCNNIGNEMILSNENHHTLLYLERKFESWEACENFIIMWAKQQSFRIVKDRVVRFEGIIRRRTYICSHSHTYESNSTRDTVTKKIGCPFVVNASCSKLKNPEEYVIINKIVEQHSHPLDVSIVEFEDSRKFTDSMIEDIKFMTVSCKFGATAQRKFLEGKYPTHPLYSRELYNTIQRFRPTKESLLNDAAKLSNWLDSQRKLILVGLYFVVGMKIIL